MSLKEIYDKKHDIRALEMEIVHLKEQYGIDKMEEELATSIADLKEMLSVAYKSGTKQEGSIMIVNKGKPRRSVNMMRIMEDEDLFNSLATGGFFSLTVKNLTEYNPKIVDMYCDTTIQDSLDIIDIVEGD